MPIAPKNENYVTNKAYTLGSDNGTYTGQWGNNAPLGKRTFKSSSYTIEGNWANGSINGQAVINFSDGSVQKGNFYNNKLNGAGSEIYTSNGYTITNEGSFTDGRLTGQGKRTEIKGNTVSSYEGTFLNGKFTDGKYVQTENNQVISSGTYTNGNYVSDKQAIAGGAAEIIGGVIQDEHPIIGGLLEEFGEALQGD